MTFATYTPADNPPQQATPRLSPAQLSDIERFMADRIRTMIEYGWTWGQIAVATGLTPAQAQWYANHA